MVYITVWDEFVEKSVQLFRADPEKTRYCMKYRHCDGKLVLKVTDDKVPWSGLVILASLIEVHYLLSAPIVCVQPSEECIKFKTDQAQDAKKMEKLNNIFFTLMARGPEVDISEVTGKEQAEAQPTKKGRGRKQ